MLIELKEYLKEHGDASLAELCKCPEFDVSDPDAMRKMLDKLIKKGVVRKKQDALRYCTKCPQCPKLSNSEIYEWVKQEEDTLN